VNGVWQDQAACRNAIAEGLVTGPDNDPWFPKGDRHLAQVALDHCAVCPVVRECRTERDNLRETYGHWSAAERTQSVWGGKLTGSVPRESPELHTASLDARRLPLYRQGMSDHQIAEREGIKSGAIWAWREKNSLPANRPSIHPPNSTTERRKEWHSWGFTDQRMADLDGVPVATIMRWRARWHLPKNTGRHELNQAAG
jgi:hypothetical protein